jgi:hypothetical protein
MLRPTLALLALAGLSFTVFAAKPDKPDKPKKKASNYVAGKPAFTPDASIPPFDATKVTPDHLEPGAFKVPEGPRNHRLGHLAQFYNPANMDIDHMGRVWVTEGINYRRHSGRSREGDCIRVLEGHRRRWQVRQQPRLCA